MLPGPPGRVLDVGCGAGDNAALLAGLGWRVTGLTIDPLEREAALPYCDEIYICDLEDGFPESLEGAFDVILMSHVLEHIAKPDKLLADVRDRLSSNGVVAVALPNALHYSQRLRFLFGDFEYSDTGILDRTHVRFYTYVTGRGLLADNGFDIVRDMPDGWLPLWKLGSLVSESRRRKINRWACRRMPNLLAYQSLFIARVSKRV